MLLQKRKLAQKHRRGDVSNPFPACTIGAHRDRVNAKVMKDPRMQAAMVPKEMPFDVKRMLYGGFEVIVEA